MKKAVILCAGKGEKMWPYTKIRSKVMIPVSNKPIVAHAADTLIELGFEKIVLVCSGFEDEIKNYFRDYPQVVTVTDPASRGTAFSLLKAEDEIGGDDFLALYGDTIIDIDDYRSLISAFEGSRLPCALVNEVTFDRNIDHVGCTLDGDEIDEILGHSDDVTHFFGGFAFSADIFNELRFNSGRFTSVDVGIMPHIEGYLEMTLSDIMARGGKVLAVEAKKEIFDLDKPWHIMQANAAINERLCSALTENVLAEGARIDPTASVSGFVKLGKNSFIGRNVIIEGNIIVGDNTRIYNGAIISGDTVIGSRSAVRNACFIAEGSTIGDDCIVSHAAELEGVLFRRVFLYHYMELYGVIGENTDLGAATVCGTLRFDSGVTVQRCRGRKEFPKNYSDASYLGDYCRTGVNAILMPGVKTGAYSIVGAGVLLDRDVPDNTVIYKKQELVEKPWSSDKYGW